MKYLVRVPIASLYLRPESPCELADEALCGWSLELLEELPEGWCKVKTHYGYTGFTRRNSLVDTDALVAAWQQRPKAVVTRFTADILDAPKVQGGCVETLTRGSTTPVTSGW